MLTLLGNTEEWLIIASALKSQFVISKNERFQEYKECSVKIDWAFFESKIETAIFGQRAIF